MNMMKRILGVGAAAIMAVLAVQSVQSQNKKVIGVLPATVINDVFMNNLAAFAVAKGEELGVSVEVHGVSGHGAIEEQVSAVEALISRQVNGIILRALDSRGLAPVVKRVKEAGIPLVMVDAGVETDPTNYVTYIRTDNVRASGLAADYAASLLSYQGKVAQLEGEPGSETAANRVKGFHEAIAKYPDIELVSSITGHWTTPGAVEATEAILSANPDVDLIFASSDLMAVGAAEVLRRRGRTDVMLIGFDGLEEGTDLVLSGRAAGDVAQNARNMGEMSMEILIDIINGSRGEDEIDKEIDSGMRLIHPWNVKDYRRDALGLAE